MFFALGMERCRVPACEVHRAAGRAGQMLEQPRRTVRALFRSGTSRARWNSSGCATAVGRRSAQPGSVGVTGID
ncbi:hypothetical protein HBB16_12160 [Pseudonocardia sp. MCCB 268]|nr:hypothetical protein [Pseudonocardia cytotoxica]